MNRQKGHLPFLIFFAVLCNSCSYKSAKIEANCPVIRYVNMTAICAYIDSVDEEYTLIMNERKTYLREIELVRNADSAENYASASKKLNELSRRIKALDKRLDAYRKKNMIKINSILNKFSTEYQIDYVLNYSEHVIYADKKYDITQSVVRELEKLKKRQGPVMR